MTTKELINQYVTAHADNRWMDASELEALLTEFAEKLKEPESEELEKEIESMWAEEDRYRDTDYKIAELSKEDYTNVARHFAQWQKEQMMKDAIGTTIDGKVVSVIVIDE